MASRNILIIEDEEHAASRLKRMAQSFFDGVFFHGPCQTIKEAIKWLQDNPCPDLIFSDIQLADGLSFSIFENVSTRCPVIFTTAFDQYALRAFESNGIDYLLKPIEADALARAIQKFQNFANPVSPAVPDWKQVISDYQSHYKQRFLSNFRDEIRMVEAHEVNYFYSEDKTTFAKAQDGRSYLIDFSLEALEELTDPKIFFRVNRKYMVKLSAVTVIRNYSNGRIKVELVDCDDEDIVLSREKTTSFKEWIDR